MAKNYGILVCLVIMALDVVAGILGIEAEIAQNKVKHLRMLTFECRDPSNQAFKLGLAAILFLPLAHIIANLLGGCACLWSTEDFGKASHTKQLAAASLFISWIILAIGFTMLVIGTMANSKSIKSCGLLHHHMLSIGGILCFLHGIFAVAFYVSATASGRDHPRHQTPDASQA
ncbi:hypothetical protein SADUNF_Sadunf04G0017600 [Salix dunnii]|uniref:Uncharacterized protein n=1 Tax=Salix dunnii TaxID=1413687 RepID=A0A835K3C9_9ROSI|nr:hypothetical protein SADUNF_Sadunf04G0017600 [Salix dunnii]